MPQTELAIVRAHTFDPAASSKDTFAGSIKSGGSFDLMLGDKSPSCSESNSSKGGPFKTDKSKENKVKSKFYVKDQSKEVSDAEDSV